MLQTLLTGSPMWKTICILICFLITKGLVALASSGLRFRWSVFRVAEIIGRHSLSKHVKMITLGQLLVLLKPYRSFLTDRRSQWSPMFVSCLGFLLLQQRDSAVSEVSRLAVRNSQLKKSYLVSRLSRLKVRWLRHVLWKKPLMWCQKRHPLCSFVIYRLWTPSQLRKTPL